MIYLYEILFFTHKCLQRKRMSTIYFNKKNKSVHNVLFILFIINKTFYEKLLFTTSYLSSCNWCLRFSLLSGSTLLIRGESTEKHSSLMETIFNENPSWIWISNLQLKITQSFDTLKFVMYVLCVIFIHATNIV